MNCRVKPGVKPGNDESDCGANVRHQRRSSRLRLVHGLNAIEYPAEITLRNLNIIVRLQVEPELRRRAERLSGDQGLDGERSQETGSLRYPDAGKHRQSAGALHG